MRIEFPWLGLLLKALPSEYCIQLNTDTIVILIQLKLNLQVILTKDKQGAPAISFTCSESYNGVAIYHEIIVSQDIALLIGLSPQFGYE